MQRLLNPNPETNPCERRNANVTQVDQIISSSTKALNNGLEFRAWNLQSQARQALFKPEPQGPFLMLLRGCQSAKRQVKPIKQRVFLSKFSLLHRNGDMHKLVPDNVGRL